MEMSDLIQNMNVEYGLSCVRHVSPTLPVTQKLNKQGITVQTNYLRQIKMK